MNTTDTAFVNLRAVEPEDLDLLYKIENDREMWSVGSTNVPYSRYVLHDYIANASCDIYADNQVRLIIENSEKEAVGIVDVVNFSPQHCRAEVSIAVMNKHRRRGYASAAVAKIKDYARRVLHLHQLYAVVSEHNAASLALFARAGFSADGTLGDWLFDGTEYQNAVLLRCVL